jgi:pimeloyl-ACP methyl ester carboxylesterase
MGMQIEVEPGVTLFVQDLGAGRPVVLVAGFGLDHTAWDAEVRLLTEHHRVVCVDQRGHGRSDKPLGGYEVDRLAADLIAVLDALDLRDVTLVGWSFGGQVAFKVAADAPERLAQLVLVGSNGVSASRTAAFPFGAPADAVEPMLVAGEQNGRLAARRAALVQGFHGDPDPDILNLLLQRSLRMPSWAAVACYQTMLRADLVDRIPDVRLPVLQLIGAEDPVHSAKGARWLTEQLCDARLVELADCGHFPMFEAPAAFDAALVEFVGSV